MKSILLNIINISLVAFILIIIYLLVFNDGQYPEPVLKDLAGTRVDQASTKVSIKQLDSLSASANFHFSKYYTANLLPGE
ncbi:MAG: hypothetical protein U5J96_08375 [Ignavibacteriaceae bacterium]|nr:hypothetical protein [Ignavibacteriaceae bacterium]